MNGTIISETPIAVDFWQMKKCRQSKIFFLSHAHSDHTIGLSSTWRQPIYCSQLTGKIAVAKCGVKESLIRPLAVGESHIIPLDDSTKETMTVTLLDANHCPGATMFLFEGYFGRILYTGDFRYQPSMVATGILKGRPAIDRLYLDNTYNMPACEFPSEIDCKMKIMQILAEHPNVDVVIGLHQLGKEDLLVDIANFFEEHIQVTPERLSLINHVECDSVFTTEQCRIRVVPVHSITIGSVERWNSVIPTVVIIPSAVFKVHRKSQLEKHPRVFIIPYSNHSSYSELMEFVKQLRPRKVLPIVQPSLSKAEECHIADTSNFECYLDETPATAFSIPASVEAYMNSSSVYSFTQWQSKKRCLPIKVARIASKGAKGVVFDDDSGDDDRKEDDDRKNPNPTGSLEEKCGGPMTYGELSELSPGQFSHHSTTTQSRIDKSPSKRSNQQGSSRTWDENTKIDNETFADDLIVCFVSSAEEDKGRKWSPLHEHNNSKGTFEGIDIIAKHLRKSDYQLDCYKAICNFYAAMDKPGVS